MAHKTLINGTAYKVTGGKTKVNGTAYGISGGRTLVGGTGYDISFLIAFTIDGITYQAEKGMTWNQWVSSSYNTAGLMVEMGGQKIHDSTWQHYLIDSRTYGFAYTYETVVENGVYFLN